MSIQDLLDEDYDGMPQATQAERIINKFGGARALATFLGVNPASVYRWTYPKERGGSDGIIPTQALRKVLKAAREQGIYITANDLYPGRG